jgi:hypothetical protein
MNNFTERLEPHYIKQLEGVGIKIRDEIESPQEYSLTYNQEHAMDMPLLHGLNMLGECLLLFVKANSITNKNILNSFEVSASPSPDGHTNTIKITFKIG